MPKRKFDYNSKRYWYHISTTLKKKVEHLIPWDEDTGFNRGGDEPVGKRICVAPTIEQCITAIPYSLDTYCSIYRTKQKIKADKPSGVFDANITHEGWLLSPTTFVKIGKLDFANIEKTLNIENVIQESAAHGKVKISKEVLKWWKRIDIKQFIKYI